MNCILDTLTQLYSRNVEGLSVVWDSFAKPTHSMSGRVWR